MTVDFSAAVIEQGAVRLLWTPMQRDRLALVWGIWSDTDAAAHVGRSVFACQVYAKRHLKQSRRANVLLAADLARIVGVDRTTVYRSWRTKGYLHVYRTPMVQGGGRMWAVDVDSLRRLVDERPWFFDPRRMQPGHWMTSWVEDAIGDDPYLTTDEAAALIHYLPNAVTRWCRDGLIDAHRRPHVGAQHGPHGGIWVMRRSVVLAYAARRDEREMANRKAARRRVGDV
jgi:hypothetical protein